MGYVPVLTLYGYPLLTVGQKPRQVNGLPKCSDQDGFCQFVVDVIAGILDGYNAAGLVVSDNGDRFAAVTTQRKQKGIQFVIIGLDLTDDVFLSLDSTLQVHNISPGIHFLLVSPR